MAVITNFGVPTDASAGTTLMPKLQYRFRVTFSNLAERLELMKLHKMLLAQADQI